MSNRKRGAEASSPAAGTPTLTFAQVIEWIEARSEALTERAAASGLPNTAGGIRGYGRQASYIVRQLADAERHLNAVQTHAAALERLSTPRAALAPHPARASARPLQRISSIQAQLRLVRARAKGDDMLEAEQEAIHRESGLGTKNISALLARTNGSNKEQWARKALRTVTGDDRTQLAAELEGYGYGPAKQLLRGVGR